MDNAIFELRFARKMVLAPTTHNLIDLFSLDMDTDLFGMDIHMFHAKREIVKQVLNQGCKKDAVLLYCKSKVTRSLVAVREGVTNEHMAIIMETISFFLVHHEQCKHEKWGSVCIELLLLVLVSLLASNKEAECKTWIRENLLSITALRTQEGDSILHKVFYSQLLKTY